MAAAGVRAPGRCRMRPQTGPCLARVVEPAVNHTQRPCLARVLDTLQTPSHRLRAVAETSSGIPAPGSDVADGPSASSGAVTTQAIDRRANRRFLERIALCTTEKDFCIAARSREIGRSSTELGAVLHSMRQLVPDVKNPSSDIKVLQKELLQEAKNSLKYMTNRSVANVIFNLTLLRAADKVLLAAAAQEISDRVRGDAKAFKMLEVAQIARAYRSMRFINPKLTRALSRAFLSLDVGELNPLSVCNLLYDCMQLGIRQGKMTDRMVDYLIQNCMLLDAKQCRTVVEAVHNQQLKNRTQLLSHVQMGLCRQPPNRIGALTAARLLRRLAQINSLKPETAQLLIARLQQEDTFGRPVQAVMQDAEPLLSKLGYQVNLASRSSQLPTASLLLPIIF